MRVVALEGPSYSGKSTLAEQLSLLLGSTAAHVSQDYVQAAGAGFVMPETPAASVDEELRGMRTFLEIDAQRWKLVAALPLEPSIVLLDRSIHTLLAHRYAVTKLLGRDAFTPASALAASYGGRPPETICYLDAPSEILQLRSRGTSEGCPPPLFRSNKYNSFFREYFLPVLRWSNTPVVVLDAGDSPSSLALQVIHQLGMSPPAQSSP